MNATPSKTAESDKRASIFLAELKAKRETGEKATTTLSTDDRVLARITDGIYRQPSSALRELISNAYDADATEVIIQTDAPRFNTITIRDNGNGMSDEALTNLIHHIGGSLKRSSGPEKYGVTDEKDPTLSPIKKRKLIGKIGIGLFSVSQLTNHFQIITKKRGEKFRRFADVTLRTYTEDELAQIINNDGEPKKFETGHVEVVSIHDPDANSQGTDIILLDLKKSSKELLQSRETWFKIISPERIEDDGDAQEEGPVFHIGRAFFQNLDAPDRAPNLPWEKTDKPEAKFEKLTQAVINQVGVRFRTPKIEDIFDNYLQTIWALSLAAPLPYVDIHPFDVTSADDIKVYQISNDAGEPAKEIILKQNEKIRSTLKLDAPFRIKGDEFNVYFDDVLLKRPILFRGLPKSDDAVQTPLMFVGKCSPDLSVIPDSIRGGKLSFEAYLFWNSKILPKENVGVMIRINDASGVPFDKTFLKYQVSEITRLGQITAEIYVKDGLDAALNIDRESFNYAHPHYQFITKWLHRAVRQLTNQHKAIGSTVRKEKKETFIQTEAARGTQIAEALWQEEKKDLAFPKIEITSDDSAALKRRSQGSIAFGKSKVIPSKISASRSHDSNLYENKVNALVTILEAYGLLEEMPVKKQEKLINAIVDLFLGN